MNATTSPLFRPLAESLATIARTGDADALLGHLQGRGFPALGGDSEPAEVILRALGEAADPPRLAESLAPALAQVIDQGAPELRAGEMVPVRQLAFQNALRLAADLPAEATLAFSLRSLAASLEEAAREFWLQNSLAPLVARALVHQQTDARTEPLWHRLLEMSGEGPWTAERRTVLLSAWRGLLYVPPDAEAARAGQVINMDRIERGLLALSEGVWHRENGPRLVRQALRVLTETFPRSPQFWGERLGPRLGRWPAGLREEACQQWPSLEKRPNRSPIPLRRPWPMAALQTSDAIRSLGRFAYPDGTVFCNGIDGTTGRYLATPSWEKLVVEFLAQELEITLEKRTEDVSDLVDGVDAADLASTGWGVIFAESVGPEVREALSPLLALRRKQASRLFQGGYREFRLASEGGRTPSVESFLCELGAAVDAPIDPAEIPYYLLLVGSPKEINFEFQYHLDLGHAVGRICFNTPEEYAAYAEAVVAAENGKQARSRRATLFGVGNNGDLASARALSDLVYPILGSLRREPLDWELETVLGDEATKERLGRLLNQDSPAFLFTASHGLALPSGHPRQRVDQGAIICHDWPGPDWKAAIPPAFYFGADDLKPETDLTGLVAFCFACFSAATPGAADFATLPDPGPAVEKSPFVAGLAQKLLARGALAVIGHVDRVWLHSFMHLATDRRDTRVFEQTLHRILRGDRLGHALEPFNRRHSTVSAHLANLVFDRRNGEAVPSQELIEAFLTRNDARNCILLGDPAVRLQVAG